MLGGAAEWEYPPMGLSDGENGCATDSQQRPNGPTSSVTDCEGDGPAPEKPPMGLPNLNRNRSQCNLVPLLENLHYSLAAPGRVPPLFISHLHLILPQS